MDAYGRLKAARAALSNIPPRITKIVGETTDKVKSAAAKQVENTVAAAKDIGGKAKATAKKAASNVKQKLKSTTKESCRNAKGNANRLDDVADTPNSFVAGTLVVMADGSTKPIEKVKPGDTVKATNAEAGVTEDHQVAATVTGKGGKELVELTLVGAGSGGGGPPAEITATAGHKFYSPAKGWTEAGDLKVGDTLRDAKGRKVTVARTVDYTQATTVYNLTIDGIHTYYVEAGETSVLVHNCDAGDPNAKGGVYTLRDADDNVVRTGRTNNLARREREHARADETADFRFQVEYRTDVYRQQRGLEQIIWMLNGRPTLPNVRRTSPVDVRNRNYNKYMDAAGDFFGKWFPN